MATARHVRFALTGPVLLAGLAACASIRTESELSGPARLVEPASYAWVSTPPRIELFDPQQHDGERIEDAALAEQVRRAADSELEARGLHAVERDQAELLLLQRASTHVRYARRDPYFSGPEAVRYEDGTLSLELYDAATGESIWKASGTSRLRDLAEGYGVYSLQYVASREERDWKVPEKIAALFEHFPLPRRE